MVLDTTLYRAANNPGTVYFRIQGYDASGNMVAGVDDIIQLYIANKASTGQINAVDLGVATDEDCTLLDLPDGHPNAPVFVKYQVDNPDGFLQGWALSVTRGNNHKVPVTASGVIPASLSGSRVGRSVPVPRHAGLRHRRRRQYGDSTRADDGELAA